MKIILPALVALCASWCAPASAAPQQGSKVVIPPLISQAGSRVNIQSSARPMTIRLPTQAGNVSKMVATNLVAKGPSWIAKGDKYYSLCVPNRKMVSCAPIVATDVMEGIEVGAVVGAKGQPLITFKLDGKITPKRTVYTVNYFLVRTNKQVAHFNRMAVSYAQPAQQTSLRVGATSNLVDAGEGGGCSYNDDGSYDCAGGGGYESGGEGGGGGNSIPGAPAGQCEGNCNYPSGNSNGDSDPCIAPDGSRICNSSADIPSVPVPGERPAEEPMGLPVCRPVGPGVIQCGTPPVVGGFPDIPVRTAPWFSQNTCNQLPVLCSRGQVPNYEDWDRGNDFTVSGKTLEQLAELCNKQFENDSDTCTAMSGAFSDSRSRANCYAKASDRNTACLATAREVTDHGAHVAP